MSDPIERYLVAQGMVGIALSDRGLSRQEILNGMAEVGLTVNHPELSKLMQSITPSLVLAWAECGFPKLEPSHRLAASFMATSISAETADALKMPWRAFSVEIPSGLLDDRQYMILVVNSRDGNLWTLATLPGPLIDLGVEPSLGAYVDVRLKPRAASDTPEQFAEFSWPRQERIVGIVGRFLIGVIAEIGEHRPSCKRPTRQQIRDALTGDPDNPRTCRPTTFKLTRSVSVDVRKEVRAYADGAMSHSITTRCLVRGHWKQQAHGLQHQHRKLIHIEPYWRGDENAPIAIRSHIMDGNS